MENNSFVTEATFNMKTTYDIKINHIFCFNTEEFRTKDYFMANNNFVAEVNFNMKTTYDIKINQIL